MDIEWFGRLSRNWTYRMTADMGTLHKCFALAKCSTMSGCFYLQPRMTYDSSTRDRIVHLL